MPSSDPLTIARWLVHERGFSVIAVDHPDATNFADEPTKIGKVPCSPWKLFQLAPPTDDNLVAWFGNGTPRNPAIVTGAVSNVVVVDGDSPAALAWMTANLPATEMRTRTAKGEHWYFRHPGAPIRNKARIQTDAGHLQLDVRADGGYVVAPTAKHANGITYERLGAWPPVDQLPVFDPTWIVVAPEMNDMPTPTARTCATDDRDHLLRRARAYVAAVPPAVEGHGGDAHTFQLACKLVRGFSLSVGDAIDLLRDWNQTCVPPWTHRELEAKIASAVKYGSEPVGARAADRPFVPVVTGPTDECFPLSDTGNAEAFAAWHGDRVRYDHRRSRWLVWSAHRFTPDADAHVDRLVKETIRGLQARALTIDDSDKRKSALKWALASESRQRREAMLALVRSERPIADSGDTWDTDPWLLGVSNGTLDLRTASLRDGWPEDRITLSAAVPYDPLAHCPRWESTLSDIFNGDPVLLAYVQKWAGYSLTGLTAEQCWLSCIGHGSNGKSTLLNALAYMLGDYAYTMPVSTILAQPANAPTNDLAALVGRRFVIASEVRDGAKLDEARVKMLTGGDSITARFLHHEFFEFLPVLKLWLSVNHRPLVRDDSHAFWRRMRVLPFTRTFPVNAALADALKAEAPGILAWAVRGCLQWQAEGLGLPDAVGAATDAYQHESDVLGDFLADACAVDAEADISGADFYRGYVAWAERQGLSDRERLTQTLFGRKVAERFEKVRTSRGTAYRGVQLNRVAGFS